MSLPRLAALLLLFAFGCRYSSYDAAAKADTAQAWRDFLKKNPSDPEAGPARERLAELELAEAQKVHTVVAYKRFLEEFEDTVPAPKARALLEALRFNAAKEKGTAQALRQFLRDHPDGAHQAEAAALLATLEAKELDFTEDPKALRAMASAHPDDPKGAEAAGKLDDRVFASATTAGALYGYLREYPAGAHRDEAKVKLLDLKIQGLLVSGLTAEAKAEAQKSPLGAQVPQLKERLGRFEKLQALANGKDDQVKRALPDYYLRSFDDVVRSLEASDPMDRWQAAEELGDWVTVRSIDPLLNAFRASRHPLVRQRAFESLGRVLRALPRPVAEYEVATRLESLEVNASDPQLFLTMGVLLDLLGQLERAAGEYQKGYDPGLPDPVVLRRWAMIRKERRQFFSEAVAARQLALWAAELARNTTIAAEGPALPAARTLCAAAEAARFAEGAIAEAQKEKTEFPDDLVEFARRASDARKLTEAKLRDAELKLLEQDPSARKCGDDSVRARLKDAEEKRTQALASLVGRPAAQVQQIRELALYREPAPELRARLAGP